MSRYQLHAADDLAKLPPPRYLVKPFIQECARNELFGPSGAGKTFLALDWACCVAAGVDWNGHRVIGGPVVYVAAEGRAGLGVRVEAWRQSRGLGAIPNLWFITQAVNFLDSESVRDARAAIDALGIRPVLVVIDTMARSMAGGDENSAKDVGRYIAATDAFARTWGAASLGVAHTGKSGELERGSSALRGAADTMHALRKDKAGLWLKSSKAKDRDDYPPVRLRLEPFAKSCVITVGSSQRDLDSSDRLILQSLPEENGSYQVTTTELHTATGIPSSTFYTRLESLSAKGFVGTTKDGRHAYKWITPAGRTALLPITPNDYHHSSTTTTPTTPSPSGDGSGSSGM